MIALVLLLSCGLVGYGNWLPAKSQTGTAEGAAVPVIEETMKETPAPETSTLAVSALSAIPSVQSTSFESVGAASSIRDIVEPVVNYMEDEVQKAEEEKAAEELERENRDESQRVYSTAVIGSVTAVEDMAIATSAPLDMSTVLLSTTDASGNRAFIFSEDGMMKIWREDMVNPAASQTAEDPGEKEEQTESLTGSLEAKAEEESSEEDSYEEESYEEETYEEESSEEETHVEESYEEESSEESQEEEESSEEESSEEESEESSSEDEEESENQEESEDEEESKEEESEEQEDSENKEDSEDDDSEDNDDSEDDEEDIPTYDIPSDGDYYYDYSWEIFSKTNALRESLGIAPLSWSDDLASFAAIRAQEITVSFSHYRPGGGHYSNYGPCHENIAWGYPTVDAVFEGWYTSPDHYDNLTDPTMTSVGISSYCYEGIMYWVMSFW